MALELALLAAAGPAVVLAPTACSETALLAPADIRWSTTLQERVSAEAISRVSSFDWVGSVALNRARLRACRPPRRHHRSRPNPRSGGGPERHHRGSGSRCCGQSGRSGSLKPRRQHWNTPDGAAAPSGFCSGHKEMNASLPPPSRALLGRPQLSSGRVYLSLCRLSESKPPSFTSEVRRRSAHRIGQLVFQRSRTL